MFVHYYPLCKVPNFGSPTCAKFVQFFSWQMVSSYVILKFCAPGPWARRPKIKGSDRKSPTLYYNMKSKSCQGFFYLICCAVYASGVLDVPSHARIVCWLAPWIQWMLASLLSLSSAIMLLIVKLWLITASTEFIAIWITSLSFDKFIIQYNRPFVKPFL